VSSDLSDRLRALQGVTGVGSTTSFPLRGSQENSLLMQFHGEPMNTVKPMGARQRFVSAGYFDAAGTKVVKGRDFGPDDRPDTTPVALVNQTFVNRYLSGREPIGLQFAAGYPIPDPTFEFTVIASSRTCARRNWASRPSRRFYTAQNQNWRAAADDVVSTSLADFAPLQGAIREEVKRHRSADRGGLRTGDRHCGRHDSPPAAGHDADADFSAPVAVVLAAIAFTRRRLRGGAAP
jgi:hypothetical protein